MRVRFTSPPVKVGAPYQTYDVFFRAGTDLRVNHHGLFSIEPQQREPTLIAELDETLDSWLTSEDTKAPGKYWSHFTITEFKS